MLNSNSENKKSVASVLMCLISLISALNICCCHSASAAKDDESTTSSTNSSPVDNAVSQKDTDDKLAAFKRWGNVMYNQASSNYDEAPPSNRESCCNVC